MKKLIFIFILSSITVLAQNHEHLPPGGRRALHGMVLFGSGTYFLEHIPMLTPPHDFQIVAQVRLTDRNGKNLTQDFSRSGYTLKPNSTFSLNDYVAGRLRKFVGSIHRGSFEQGGKIFSGLEEVSVEVMEYKVVRQLPADSNEKTFIFSDGTAKYESNVIRPGQNIQKIKNLSIGVELWCVTGPDFFDPCH